MKHFESENEVFTVTKNDDGSVLNVSLIDSLKTSKDRSDSIHEILSKWRNNPDIVSLRGWRNEVGIYEMYAVI